MASRIDLGTGERTVISVAVPPLTFGGRLKLDLRNVDVPFALAVDVWARIDTNHEGDEQVITGLELHIRRGGS